MLSEAIIEPKLLTSDGLTKIKLLKVVFKLLRSCKVSFLHRTSHLLHTIFQWRLFLCLKKMCLEIASSSPPNLVTWSVSPSSSFSFMGTGHRESDIEKGTRENVGLLGREIYSEDIPLISWRVAVPASCN